MHGGRTYQAGVRKRVGGMPEWLSWWVSDSILARSWPHNGEFKTHVGLGVEPTNRKKKKMGGRHKSLKQKHASFSGKARKLCNWNRMQQEQSRKPNRDTIGAQECRLWRLFQRPTFTLNNMGKCEVTWPLIVTLPLWPPCWPEIARCREQKQRDPV